MRDPWGLASEDLRDPLPPLAYGVRRMRMREDAKDSEQSVRALCNIRADPCSTLKAAARV